MSQPLFVSQDTAVCYHLLLGARSRRGIGLAIEASESGIRLLALAVEDRDAPGSGPRNTCQRLLRGAWLAESMVAFWNGRPVSRMPQLTLS